jgi:hypothetical protein
VKTLIGIVALLMAIPALGQPVEHGLFREAFIGPCSTYGFPNQSTSLYFDDFSTKQQPIPEAGFTCQSDSSVTWQDIWIFKVSPGQQVTVILTGERYDSNLNLAVLKPSTNTFIYNKAVIGTDTFLFTAPPDWGLKDGQSYCLVYIGSAISTTYTLYVWDYKTSCPDTCQSSPGFYCTRNDYRTGICTGAGPTPTPTPVPPTPTRTPTPLFPQLTPTPTPPRGGRPV